MLSRGFYAIDAATLAQRLLGCVLVRLLDDGTRVGGVIVETEAYLGVPDKASHAFGGRRTPRNEAMYGPPGTAYVYFTYGMHYCFNVVCASQGDPQAVLIRALEPVAGLDHMRRLRSAERRASRRGSGAGGELDQTLLCSGPARLCQALSVDRALNGHDLVVGRDLWIEPPARRSSGLGGEIVAARRIGVDYAGEWAAELLRWLVAGNPHVSKPPQSESGTATRATPERKRPSNPQPARRVKSERVLRRSTASRTRAEDSGRA